MFWCGVILVEMKSRGKDLEKSHKQARDYSFYLENEDLPEYSRTLRTLSYIEPLQKKSGTLNYLFYIKRASYSPPLQDIKSQPIYL